MDQRLEPSPGYATIRGSFLDEGMDRVTKPSAMEAVGAKIRPVPGGG